MDGVINGFSLHIEPPSYHMKTNEFGVVETKLFHFHSTFKNGRQGGVGFEGTPSTHSITCLKFSSYNLKGFKLDQRDYHVLINGPQREKIPVFCKNKTNLFSYKE